MLLKVVISLSVVLALFLIYVSTRPATFHYETSGLLNAPPEKIFPYISDLKAGSEWSPFEQADPNMKKEYVGTPNQVGAKLNFAGNKESGSGSIEILKIVPNEIVELKLIMTEPMHGESIVTYRLTPEADGTRFSWSLSGDSGFMGKLISVFMDCEKMCVEQFQKGINNLKTIVERAS